MKTLNENLSNRAMRYFRRNFRSGRAMADNVGLLMLYATGAGIIFLQLRSLIF